MTTKINTFVGLRRISRRMSPAMAASTKDARVAMQQVMKNFQDFINLVVDITPEALEYTLQETFALSQTYCPVKTGALRDSGYLDVTQEGNKITAEIGYAPGGIPHYGIFVHELIDAHHEAPTRSKFLEAAINETAGDWGKRLIDFYRGSLGV